MHVKFYQSYKNTGEYICNRVSKVYSNNSKIIVHFSNSLGTSNPRSVSKYFGYYTEAYNLPLLEPPTSQISVTFLDPHEKSSIEIEFSFLFDYYYNGILFCANDKYKPPLFHTPYYSTKNIIRSFPLNISYYHIGNSSNNQQSSDPYSHLLCFGKTSQERWCKGQNIGVSSNHLIVSTPTFFVFPSNFLSLGSRAPPFHHSDDILLNEPIVTSISFQVSHLFSENILHIPELTFLFGYGTIDNDFDIIYQFAIPFFFHVSEILNTTNILNSIKFNHVKFYSRSNLLPKYFNFIKAFTEDIPLNFPNNKNLFVYSNLICGIPKIDRNTSKNRNMLEFDENPYQLSKFNFSTFRNNILSSLNIEENKTNFYNQKVISIKKNDTLQTKKQCEKRIITMFNSRKDSFYIGNLNDIKDAIINECEDCFVRILTKDNISFEEQIQAVFESDVLISRFGTGIEHLIWLKPGATAIEIKPYGLWCDHRIREIANLAGINYIEINSISTKNNTSLQLRECFDSIYNCLNQKCTHLLRSQSVTVNVSEFVKIWKKLII